MRELSLSDVNMDAVHLRSWIEFVRPSDDRFAERLHKVRGLIAFIPPLERDVIELHFFAQRNQEQIAGMLGLTQQAVSHRMHRAFTRLAFLLDHPLLTVGQVRRDLRTVWPGAPDIMPLLLTQFARTSSQTETARLLRVPQQHVRRHLAHACRHFREHASPLAVKYAEMIARLLANRSILCDVPGRHRGNRPVTCQGRRRAAASARARHPAHSPGREAEARRAVG